MIYYIRAPAKIEVNGVTGAAQKVLEEVALLVYVYYRVRIIMLLVLLLLGQHVHIHIYIYI